MRWFYSIGPQEHLKDNGFAVPGLENVENNCGFTVSGLKNVNKALVLWVFHVCGAQKLKKPWLL